MGYEDIEMSSQGYEYIEYVVTWPNDNLVVE